MICSREDTEEGREQEKVSIKTEKKPGAGIFLLPLAMVAPIIAGTVLVSVRLWPHIQKLLNLLIKLVVRA